MVRNRKIYSFYLNHEPKASNRTLKARKALNDSIDEYLNAVLEDRFYKAFAFGRAYQKRCRAKPVKRKVRR